MREFLSTFSLRRATLELKPISNFGLISIHALLAESDLPQSAKVGVGVSFLSTLSLRRATYDLHGLKMGYCISIHALLAESDCAAAPCPHGRCYFYPRSPCGERRVRCLRASLRPSFLSTLSLRRATHLQGHGLLTVVISIHALLAESDVRGHLSAQPRTISIHALLAESDCYRGACWSRFRNFYPRSPCGERLLSLSLRPKSA